MSFVLGQYPEIHITQTDIPGPGGERQLVKLSNKASNALQHVHDLQF